MNTKRVRQLATLVAAVTGSAGQRPHEAEEQSHAGESAPAADRLQPPNPQAISSRRPNRNRERRELLERPETLEAVCELLIEGHSLRAIAANRELFPMENSASHLLRWLTGDPARLQRYARAREAAADLLADQVVEVSREQARDPQCRRVEIDALKWYAAKLRPKVYGDRIEQDITAKVSIEDELLKLAAKGD
jgi:hypothetical protein